MRIEDIHTVVKLGSRQWSAINRQLCLKSDRSVSSDGFCNLKIGEIKKLHAERYVLIASSIEKKTHG